MTPAIHHSVDCKNRGERIWLHHKSLGYVFADPTGHSVLSVSLAFVCPHCKQVRTLSKKEIREGPQVSVLPDIQTVFYKWLECEKETCTLRIPLYALWSAETTAMERLADTETWVWVDLTCPDGHPIAKPEA